MNPKKKSKVSGWLTTKSCAKLFFTNEQEDLSISRAQPPRRRVEHGYGANAAYEFNK
jgi:hypothetical protein